MHSLSQAIVTWLYLLKRFLCIRTQIDQLLLQLLSHSHNIFWVRSNRPVLNSHPLKLVASLPTQRAEVNTRGMVNLFDALHDQFDLFGQRPVLLAIHLVLEHKIQHHYLACCHGVTDLLPFLLSPMAPFPVELFGFLLTHCGYQLVEFIFFCLPTLVVPLFSEFCIIEIPLQSFNFFLMPLGFRLVILAFLFLIGDELVHALFEDVEERIVSSFFLRLLVQHYNSKFSFTSTISYISQWFGQSSRWGVYYLQGAVNSWLIKQYFLNGFLQQMLTEPRGALGVAIADLEGLPEGTRVIQHNIEGFIWMVMRVGIQLIRQRMFDEEFGLYNENSLDLLLRFHHPEQLQDNFHSSDLFSDPSKDVAHTEDLLSPPLEPFQEDPVLSQEPQPVAEIEKMREACSEQEAKVVKLIEGKERERPKICLSLKRKISECTEAPNSPLRKTKMVKKDKQ